MTQDWSDIKTLRQKEGEVFGLVAGNKEQGRNNFPNYASQLQTTFARSQIPKVSK